MLQRSLLCIILYTAVAVAQPYQLERYRLFNPAGDAQNLIYPGSMLIDEWRGICYVASDSIAGISRISIAEKRLLGTYDERHGIVSPIRMHAFEPSQRLMYVSQHYTLPATITLQSYALSTNSINASLNLGPCNWLNVIADTKRRQLYVSSGRRHILILNSKTLVPEDSINTGVQLAGMHFDSTNAELFVCQFKPINGLTTIQRFSVVNHQRLGTMTFAANEPVTSVRVDPELNRVMALNNKHVWLFDEFGSLVFDYAINGGIGDIAASSTFHETYFTDVLGDRYPDRGGRLGKIFSFGFREFEVDSLEIGTGRLLLSIHNISNTAVVVSKATTTASLYRLPDFFPIADIELGESVDQLGLLPGVEPFIALNHLGASNELLSVDPAAGISHVPTGFFPSSITTLPHERRFAVVSHHESAVYLHDSAGSFIQSVVSGLAHYGDKEEYPAITYDGVGKLLVAWPEQGVFSLIDASSLTIDYEFYLEGLNLDEGKGPGLVQPLFIPGRTSYCFLSIVDRQLALYNAATHQYEQTLDLTALDWSIIEPFEDCCLQSSELPGYVFVGPYLIDTDGVNDPQQILPEHSRLLGSSGSMLWAIRSHSDSVHVIELEGSSGSILTSIPLQELNTDPNAIAASFEDSRLILGYKDNAEIFDIRFHAVNSIAPVVLAQAQRLRIFPNPYSAGTGRRITVELPSSTQGLSDLIIQDLSGREVFRVGIPSMKRQISFSMPVATPGCYTISVVGKQWHGSTQLLILK